MCVLEYIAVVLSIASVLALLRKNAALSVAASGLSLRCGDLARRWRESRGSELLIAQRRVDIVAA